MRTLALVIHAVAALAGCGSAVTPPLAPKPEPPIPPVATPTTLVRRDFAVGAGPMRLVVAGTTVVWTDMAGAIWTMPTEGGTPKQLSDQHSHGFAFHPVLAGTRVLVTTKRDLFAVADGVVTPLHAKLPEDPEATAADADAVYVTLFKQPAVMRVPLAGGSPVAVLSFPRGVLAAHGDTLFVASYSTGELISIAKTGGPPTKLAARLGRPTAIAADATHAFIYTETDQTLHRLDLASHEVTTLATGLVNSDEVVLDGDFVYTVSWDHPARLLRFAKTGGAPTVLANDLKSPRSIAIDGPYVWLTDRDRNLIVRVPK